MSHLATARGLSIGVLAAIGCSGCIDWSGLYGSGLWMTGQWSTIGNTYEAVDQIPASKYTHLLHYTGLKGIVSGPTTCDVGPTDSVDTTNVEAAGFIHAAHQGGAKAFFQIQNQASETWFTDCTAPERLSSFVQAIAALMQHNGYDGVHLAWYGPVGGQYAALLSSLHAALPGSAILLDAFGWDGTSMGPDIVDLVDQINVACDYEDSGDTMLTWYNEALFQAGSPELACDVEVRRLLSAGVPPAKIGIGLSFFGIKWVPAMGPDQSGSFQKSFVDYRDLAQDPIRWQASNQHFDAEHGAQYLSVSGVTPNEFIAFTGAEQIRAAVSWIRSMGFGGVEVQSMHGEFLGTQSGDDRYPLSTALKAELLR
jgi:chitinase